MLLRKRSYRNLNTLHVFKEALLHNLNVYQKANPGSAMCPVFKSNAYGHGLLQVAKALDEASSPFFIVDSLYEAYELKKARIKTPLLIIGANFPENLKGRRLPFHFAAYNKESTTSLAELKVPVHVKIDTGFNRLGFHLDELDEAIEHWKSIDLNLEGLYTHFADAENADSFRKTEEQVAIFEAALKKIRAAGFNPHWIHASNSAGGMRVKNPDFNMVRLGLGLYGIPPLETQKELKPAMELESTLVSIKDIQKGESVGYGETFIAERDMRLGVVPVGYYEALPRSLSNKGFVELRGQLCPIVGRVCMNMTMIDLSAVPEAKLFDPVIIYSRNAEQKNSVAAQSKTADMIPYELLVHISESVARHLE